MVVANVEYRLAKAAPAPAALNDVLKAAQWFYDHTAQYKVDPKRVVVMGGSAGGHLALMTGMAPPTAGFGSSIKVAAVIDFFGIADVADQISGPHRNPTPWPGFLSRLIAWNSRNAFRRSRTFAKNCPPILVLHGDADSFVPYAQSVELVKALKNAGDDAQLITVPGGKHGFTPAEMEQGWPQIFQWLKKRKVAS